MLTIKILFAKFLTLKGQYVDDTTLDRYTQTFRDIDDLLELEDKLIITSEQAYQYLGSLHKRTDISLDTKKRRIQVLNQAYKWFIQENYLSQNPFDGLDKLIKSPKRPPPNPFTTTEISQIINYFQAVNRHYAGLVKFLFWTGARPGEALALTWDKYDWEQNLLLIDKQIGCDKIEKPAKCGKYRYLSLNENVIGVLREQKLNSENNLIFPNTKGEIIHEKSFTRYHWRGCFDCLCIPYRSLRFTRHTFISHLIRKGVDPVTISKFTGHSPKVLFEHYAGLFSQPTLPSID